MPKFKIKHVVKAMSVDIYEVEAPTEQEALDKYCDELAGGIEPITDYFDFECKEKEGISIVKN